MSSTMETAILASDAPEQSGLTWKDINRQRWEKMAENCPARLQYLWSDDKYECMVTTYTCEQTGCFGLYWQNGG